MISKESKRLIFIALRSVGSVAASVLKAGKPVGSISQRSDGKYKKNSDGTWDKVSEGTGSKKDYTEDASGITLANGTKVPKEHVEAFRQVKEKFSRREPGKGGPQEIEKKEHLDAILSYTKYGIISAGRNPNDPDDKGKTDEEIKKRYEDLKEDLRDDGYVFTVQKGMYGGEEESILFMMHDSDRAEVMDIGKRYKQDSVIYSEYKQSEMVGTSEYNMDRVIMTADSYDYYGTDREDYYSEIDVGGSKVKYGINFKDVAKAMGRMVYRALRAVTVATHLICSGRV